RIALCAIIIPRAQVRKRLHLQTFTSQAVDCRYNSCAAGGWPASRIALCAIIIPRAQGRKRLRLQTFTSQAVDCQYNSCAAGGRSGGPDRTLCDHYTTCAGKEAAALADIYFPSRGLP